LYFLKKICKHVAASAVLQVFLPAESA